MNDPNKNVSEAIRLILPMLKKPQLSFLNDKFITYDKDACSCIRQHFKVLRSDADYVVLRLLIENLIANGENLTHSASNNYYYQHTSKRKYHIHALCEKKYILLYHAFDAVSINILYNINRLIIYRSSIKDNPTTDAILDYKEGIPLLIRKNTPGSYP